MAMKVCPGCTKSSGPRTLKCVCGHIFTKAEKKPVVKVDVLASSGVVEATQGENVVLPNSNSLPINVAGGSVTLIPPCHPLNGRTLTPAGPCPISPIGYKSGWPDGQPSDEVITQWARAVYDYGVEHNRAFTCEAVVYFIREYWDMNGPEYRRVRGVVESVFKEPVADNMEVSSVEEEELEQNLVP